MEGTHEVSLVVHKYFPPSPPGGVPGEPWIYIRQSYVLVLDFPGRLPLLIPHHTND